MMILTITIPTDDRNRRLTALPGTQVHGSSSAGRGGHASLSASAPNLSIFAPCGRSTGREARIAAQARGAKSKGLPTGSGQASRQQTGCRYPARPLPTRSPKGDVSAAAWIGHAIALAGLKGEISRKAVAQGWIGKSKASSRYQARPALTLLSPVRLYLPRRTAPGAHWTTLRCALSARPDCCPSSTGGRGRAVLS